MSGRGENYHCHSSNIADIKYAHRTGPLAPVERVLGPDRGGVVVDEILHETVGAKEGVRQARSLNVLLEIAMPARKHGLAPT